MVAPRRRRIVQPARRGEPPSIILEPASGLDCAQVNSKLPDAAGYSCCDPPAKSVSFFDGLCYHWPGRKRLLHGAPDFGFALAKSLTPSPAASGMVLGGQSMRSVVAVRRCPAWAVWATWRKSRASPGARFAGRFGTDWGRAWVVVGGPADGRHRVDRTAGFGGGLGGLLHQPLPGEHCWVQRARRITRANEWRGRRVRCGLPDGLRRGAPLGAGELWTQRSESLRRGGNMKARSG